METRIPARAMIDCILCAQCGKYATATGGGICEACTLRAELASLRGDLAAAKDTAAQLQTTMEKMGAEEERNNEALMKLIRTRLGSTNVHGAFDGVEQLAARAEAGEKELEAAKEAADQLQGTIKKMEAELIEEQKNSNKILRFQDSLVAGLTVQRDAARASRDEWEKRANAARVEAVESAVIGWKREIEDATARAEAAEKELAVAKMQRGLLEGYIVDAHFRAFGSRHYAYVDCRSACDLLVADINATQHERDAATAQVADLRAALADIQRNDLGRTVAHTIATNALARTPATSLAAHDAAVLRGLAEECEEVMPGDLPHITQNRLREMADQIEAEAKVVKDAE